MDITEPGLSKYSEEHTSPESPLLARINRETHADIPMPRMLSGHLQGRMLSMISRMIQPSLILEIGTYTGYSALCLAEGLTEGGRLITIDNNTKLEERVRNYFRESAYDSNIDFRIGDALEVLPGLPGPFDLVWIDADKKNYSNYYDLVIEKVRKGGYVLADNVLWSGKVTDTKPDKDTLSITKFNDKVHNDPRVENVLLPVRDGVLVMRKI